MSLAAHLSAYLGKRVVVVGDLMLDAYVRGDVRRISPEAPVPVLEVVERSHFVGGAGNTAANVCSLGGKATMVGVIGRDASGKLLSVLLEESGVDAASIVIDDSRPTTLKTRIVARSQQIVRIDEESTKPLAASTVAEIVSRTTKLLADADACIISDYAKGAVTSEICRAVIEAAKKSGVPVIVDPKQREFAKAYAGATLITPNTHELELAVGRPLLTDAELVSAAEGLLANLEGAGLLVTRGPAGMSLVRTGAPPIHKRSAARTVYDVTGAGDTVVGAIALGLAAKLPLDVAMDLANHAAGIAVSREGTVRVTSAELAEELAHFRA